MCERMGESWSRPGHAMDAAKVITIAIGKNTDALEVPPEVVLNCLEVELGSVSGASSATWYLSRDPEGVVAVTPSYTNTLIVTTGAPTRASFAQTIGPRDFVCSRGYPGQVFLQMSLDAGTATVIKAALTWRTVAAMAWKAVH